MKRMKLLSTKQAADRSGFSSRTIARWCRRGELIGARKVGRVWRISEDDLEAFLAGE